MDRAGIEFDPGVVSVLLALDGLPELESFAKTGYEEPVPTPELKAVAGICSRRFLNSTYAVFKRLVGFRIGVLRRLKFTSVALPFTGEGEICVHLKSWKVRVAANDPMLWSYTKGQALIENNTEQLKEDDLDMLLDDAYVPHDKFENPALLKWFNETDAWWFDNLRFNAERLEPYKRALALTAGMMTGDYVLSFNEQTRNLREPFSLTNAFHRMLDCLPKTQDNGMRNKSTNQDVRNFVAERHHTDLLFLTAANPGDANNDGADPIVTWREEWLRGGDDFWLDFERTRGARLGSRVQSKAQYLGFVEDLPAHRLSHPCLGHRAHREWIYHE